MELEGDQYNVRLCVQICTRVFVVVLFEIAARRKLKEQNEIRLLLLSSFSMCLYCGTICCFCDTYKIIKI